MESVTLTEAELQAIKATAWDEGFIQADAYDPLDKEDRDDLNPYLPGYVAPRAYDPGPELSPAAAALAAEIHSEMPGDMFATELAAVLNHPLGSPFVHNTAN